MGHTDHLPGVYTQQSTRDSTIWVPNFPFSRLLYQNSFFPSTLGIELKGWGKSKEGLSSFTTVHLSGLSVSLQLADYLGFVFKRPLYSLDVRRAFPLERQVRAVRLQRAGARGGDDRASTPRRPRRTTFPSQLCVSICQLPGATGRKPLAVHTHLSS